MARLLGILLLAALGFGTPAAAMEITASLDRDQAQVGDQVVLTVVVSGSMRDLKEPTLPDLSRDFDVHSAGTSRNISFVNGKVSSSFQLRYVLIPRQEGTFTIGAIEVESRGETARTSPLTLAVAAAAPRPAPPVEEDERSSVAGDDDLFVKAFVDHDRPYIFQQITYRVQLYYRVAFTESPRFDAPTFQGFWKEDLPSRDPVLTTVNGQRYQMVEVAVALFPTAPGELTIGEALLDCKVQVRPRNRDPFTLFDGRFFDGKPIQLRTEPMRIQVQPLPGGAPPGFEGAVGDYVLQAETDRTETPQNEPVTLTVKISGNGNLRTLGDIQLPELPDYRAYPQRSSQEMSPSGNVMSGTFTQEFVLVPLSTGSKTIPPVELVTFSPRAGAYRVLRTPPIPLTVTGAETPVNGGERASRSDIEVLGRDIRFIETDVPKFEPLGSPLTGAKRWLLALPLPILGYAGVLLVDRRRRRLGSDVALRRRTRAAREARKQLRRAQAETAIEGRAALAAEALRGFVADRWNLSTAGLTPDQLRSCLEGVGENPAGLLALLERCDAARFAPGLVSGQGNDPVLSAKEWIDRLEKLS